MNSPDHQTFSLGPAEPLWKRVPCRDAQGRRLQDFMLLIPGLRKSAVAEQQWVMDRLQQVCVEQGVVFADLNLRLNLLWVSLGQEHGGCLRFLEAVRFHLPQARLVASQVEAMHGEAAARRRAGRHLLGLLLPGRRRLPGPK